MKDQYAGSISIALISLLILMACTLTGCGKPPADSSQSLPPTGVRLSTPAGVSSKNLTPGLAVVYLDKFYRRVSQMPNAARAKTMGKPGKAILQLNHKAGKEGLVFDSGKKKGVGMILTGYLHLSTAGGYRFQALSNDGIECILGGKQLFADPGVHKDRLTPVGIVDVSAAGWYPLSIRYFQRKGTSALKLYWQPPGTSGFSIIPPEIFAHSNNRQGVQ
ncbi:MAG: PA14 domain-containing protein [Desulfobulbaceae bacterium]|nr:PA14 domain-containing protein [Desulfobulbaceae bacterium]